MQDFIDKKIVLGITGGVAAYKSTYLVRELTKAGARVRVVLTESAREFVSPLTLQALGAEEVRSSLFDLEAERAMGHIELARWADYLLIAPATANCLAKMANGFADDLLSTIYLVTETPVIVCPAMNRAMLAHPATAANCLRLSERGVILVGPAEGSQACGEEGLGRMVEVDEIINALRLHQVYGQLAGKTVLITAGPTREAIDPVRYISNHSSGKMGYALAQAASMAGARVILVSGPTALTPPSGVEFHRVISARQMHEVVMKRLESDMIFVAAAAVADFGFEASGSEKIKKQKMTSLELRLQPNPDILAEVSAQGKAAFVVGFAAETSNIKQNALEKLQSKQLDMIIANQVGDGLGFDVDENQVIIFTKKSEIVLSMDHKVRLAGEIIAILAASIQNGGS